MDIIFHLFGACVDNHSHIDLTDSVFILGESTIGTTIKYYMNGVMFLLKTYIK